MTSMFISVRIDFSADVEVPSAYREFRLGPGITQLEAVFYCKTTPPDIEQLKVKLATDDVLVKGLIAGGQLAFFRQYTDGEIVGGDSIRLEDTYGGKLIKLIKEYTGLRFEVIQKMINDVNFPPKFYIVEGYKLKLVENIADLTMYILDWDKEGYPKNKPRIAAIRAQIADREEIIFCGDTPSQRRKLERSYELTFDDPYDSYDKHGRHSHEGSGKKETILTPMLLLTSIPLIYKTVSEVLKFCTNKELSLESVKATFNDFSLEKLKLFFENLDLCLGVKSVPLPVFALAVIACYLLIGLAVYGLYLHFALPYVKKITKEEQNESRARYWDYREEKLNNKYDAMAGVLQIKIAATAPGQIKQNLEQELARKMDQWAIDLRRILQEKANDLGIPPPEQNVAPAVQLDRILRRHPPMPDVPRPRARAYSAGVGVGRPAFIQDDDLAPALQPEVIAAAAGPVILPRERPVVAEPVLEPGVVAATAGPMLQLAGASA